MRAIDSVILLAAITASKVHVIWEMNGECSSKFSDLFELPLANCTFTELNSGAEIDGVNRRAQYIFSQYSNCYIDQNNIDGRLSQSDWLKIVEKFRHVYITTYSRFYQAAAQLQPACVLPKAHLNEIIRSYSSKNMIGVHVRRSDHKEAIAYSPVEGFIKQMKREIEMDDEVKFFLATDSLPIEFELQKAFPGRILLHKKKSLDRKNPVAIADAVIDLFSLAACRKIIGSYWSTFSATAAHINGLESVTVREDNFSLKPFAKGEFSLLVKINEKVRVCENDSGGLLVETDRGETVQLNNTSAAILNLCNQSMTLMEILNFFTQKYPAEAQVVEENVIETLESLLARDVISVNLISKQAASEVSKTG